MPYSLSMDQHLKSNQSLKQMQRLIMSRQMQQAIHLLKVPVMELAPLVELELEQNPVLETSEEGEEELDGDVEIQRLEDEVEEDPIDIDTPTDAEVNFDDHDFEVLRRLDEDFRDYVTESGAANGSNKTDQDKLHTFLESSIVAEKSLFDHLLEQAHEAFPEERERTLAETIIGSFDESGFLATSLEELAVLLGAPIQELEKILHAIQSFHPTGIGARNLRESLLIQLKRKGKEGSLAYRIIDRFFDDLLKNHIPAIKSGLHATSEAVSHAIDRDIATLDLHPGGQICAQRNTFIIPDLTIQQEDKGLIVTIHDDSLPPLRLNRKYLRMLDDEELPKETREFIQQKVGSAKWLMRNLSQRNDTLKRIGEALTVHQQEFFTRADGNLTPLIMGTIADELELHESTIARAVSNKYVQTPRGLFPLRSFFTNAIETDGGPDISSETVRDMLLEIIKSEDRAHPLSDEVISSRMKDQGIHCARRTVAKYRIALKIGNTRQRRKF